MSNPSPYYPHEFRAARALAAEKALERAAAGLRRIGGREIHDSRRRGELTFARAMLLETASRNYRSLPREVAGQALQVVKLVDRIMAEQFEPPADPR